MYMSYTRVLPRDLFNEANLLKCIGRFMLNLETARASHASFEYDGEPFNVIQDDSTGQQCISNIQFIVSGEYYLLYRPYNSRESWPLYIDVDDNWTVQVFNNDGSFTNEMLGFLKSKA